MIAAFDSWRHRASEMTYCENRERECVISPQGLGFRVLGRGVHTKSYASIMKMAIYTLCVFYTFRLALEVGTSSRSHKELDCLSPTVSIANFESSRRISRWFSNWTVIARGIYSRFRIADAKWNSSFFAGINRLGLFRQRDDCTDNCTAAKLQLAGSSPRSQEHDEINRRGERKKERNRMQLFRQSFSEKLACE